METGYHKTAGADTGGDRGDQSPLREKKYITKDITSQATLLASDRNDHGLSIN